MGCCCLPPERVKITVNSKKETNGRVRMNQESKWAKGQSQNGPTVKMGQRSKWAKSQNGTRGKMSYCCLPPERVKLTLNSKKETSGRVKMGQESRWAAVVYP